MEEKIKKYLSILLVAVLLIGGIFFIDKSVKEINYRNDFDDIVYSIQECAVDCENTLILIGDIWHNSINKKSDEKTDNYTKNEKGLFYDDFNDALAKYYDSDEYKEIVDKITEKNNYIYELTNRLQNPPKKYNRAYEELVTFYGYYVKFMNMAIGGGTYGMNYNEFSDEFEQISRDIVTEFLKIRMFTSY